MHTEVNTTVKYNYWTNQFFVQFACFPFHAINWIYLCTFLHMDSDKSYLQYVLQFKLLEQSHDTN